MLVPFCMPLFKVHDTPLTKTVSFSLPGLDQTALAVGDN